MYVKCLEMLANNLLQSFKLKHDFKIEPEDLYQHDWRYVNCSESMLNLTSARYPTTNVICNWLMNPTYF